MITRGTIEKANRRGRSKDKREKVGQKVRYEEAARFL